MVMKRFFDIIKLTKWTLISFVAVFKEATIAKFIKLVMFYYCFTCVTLLKYSPMEGLKGHLHMRKKMAGKFRNKWQNTRKEGVFFF